MNLPHEFIFVFIQYFDGAILSEKSCIKWEAREKGGGGGGEKKHKNGYSHIAI